MKKSERRKENRFHIEDGAYAILNQDVSLLGNIIDISKNGISFSYLGSEKISDREMDIDLFMYHHNYYLDRIPARLVSNFRINNISLFSFVTLMRCCLEFREMPEDKRAEVDHFISNYTVSKA